MNSRSQSLVEDMALTTKLSKVQAFRRAILLASLIAWTAAYGQITPSGDSYTNTADPTTNYGSKTLLDVDGAIQTTYIQFNLASLPTTANISQATLKLYVNGVTTAGSFNVDYVNSAWSESTIDANNAPPLGAAIASGIGVTTADKNQYILVDVTSAVQAWLSGTETNNGIALVAESTFNATFDSKESTSTSHPPELDIAFPGGSITGVTTASGGGLTGGGTSGTLDLSLTNGCAANQVLQWNGSAWICATMSGGGSITGVTAGTDMTGGGTSGVVTLNVDTTKVPQLNAANTFTGNQTVNGNLSATGTVSGGSFEIGSNLFGFGSYANGNAFLGFAGTSTASGSYNTGSGVLALQSLTSGIENTAVGYAALQGNTAAGSNTAIGYAALQITSGSFNTATGVQALSSNTTGVQNTANGVAALSSNTTGAYNTATGLDALKFNTTANYNTAAGDGALNSNTTTCCNTAVGYATLLNSNTGGSSSQPGAQNDAFGYEALYSNTTGTNNVAFGTQALHSNTIVSYNTGVGAGAMQNTNVPSSCNVGYDICSNDAFGYQALFSNTTGSGNAAFGYQALYANTTGSDNTGFGYQAGYGGAGLVYSSSTSVSFWAAGGPNVTAVGSSAGGGAIDNTAIGYLALFGNYAGGSNTADGYLALSDSATGYENTGVGAGAFQYLENGNEMTCIGYECGANADNITNATAIGAHAIVGQSNSLVLGGTGEYAVNVGIGTTQPSNILTIGRGLGHPVSDSWETYSSRRWKTNIKTLPDALAKVEQLRGVSYDLKDSGKHEIGVIAEEVGKVVPEVVSYEKNGKDATGVDYSRLTAVLIEAVKQQQAQIRKQQAQIRMQQARIAHLASQVRTIQTSLKTGAQSGAVLNAAKAQPPVVR